MTGIMPYVCYQRDNVSQLLLKVIASTLNEIIENGEKNNSLGDVNRKITKFHGLCAPSIRIPAYLERISWYSGCSNEAFVLMIIYIDRLVTKKGIPLDALNVHRLIITAILLAAKFFDDHYLDNAHYSAVGGLPHQELNELELEMLFLLGFNLFVSTESYNTYYGTLMNMIAVRNPSRGLSIFDNQLIQQKASNVIDNNEITLTKTQDNTSTLQVHNDLKSASIHRDLQHSRYRPEEPDEERENIVVNLDVIRKHSNDDYESQNTLIRNL